MTEFGFFVLMPFWREPLPHTRKERINSLRFTFFLLDLQNKVKNLTVSPSKSSEAPQRFSPCWMLKQRKRTPASELLPAVSLWPLHSLRSFWINRPLNEAVLHFYGSLLGFPLLSSAWKRLAWNVHMKDESLDSTSWNPLPPSVRMHQPGVVLASMFWCNLGSCWSTWHN